MANRLKLIMAATLLSILAIVVAEVLARVVALPMIERVRHERRSSLPAYAEANFDVTRLIEEMESVELVEYQPYIMWRRIPFKGSLINVDAGGNRVTYNNSPRPDDALQVWMFGGSTTWGWGVPDDQTVASHLAQLINEGWGVDALVRNFGQDGYVSTQELIYFLRVLQSGRRPDVVIFLDGANDATAAALWPHIPGTHHNLGSIRSKLAGEKPSLAARARSTGLFRVARLGLRQIGIDLDAVDQSPLARAESEDETRRLAQQALHVWLENQRTVAALGQVYGFVPIFLFQPVLALGEKPLDPSEESLLTKSMAKREVGPGVLVQREMRTLLRHRLENGSNLNRIYDISDIFRDTPEPLYLDWAHVTGKGNLIIAQRISEILQSQLCREVPAHSSELMRSQLTGIC